MHRQANPPEQSPDELRHGLSAFAAGQLSAAAALRLFVSYRRWQVPSKAAPDGSPGLNMVRDPSGKWWLLVFSDAAALATYDQAQGTTLAAQVFEARGDSLARNLPAGAVGLGLDVGTPHQVSFMSHQLDDVRRLGSAVEVEAALFGFSKRGAEEQGEHLRGYDGYLIARGPTAGPAGMCTSTPGANQALYVFTAPDAWEPWAQQAKGFTTEALSAAELCAHLSQHRISTALLVGPRGLQIEYQAAELDGRLSQPVAAHGAPAAPAPTPETDSDEPPLLPILLPHEFKDADGVVCRPLLGERGQGEHSSLWVALGQDYPDRLKLLGNRTILAQRPADELESEALENLAAAPVEWERPTAGAAAQVVSCVGSQAASQVLNRPRMQELTRELGVELLAVALASQQTLVVTSGDSDEALAKLAALAGQLYENAAGQGLSRQLYLLKDGRVVGRVEVEPAPSTGSESKAEAAAGGCRACGAPLDDEGQWCMRCGAAQQDPTPFDSADPLQQVMPIIQPHDWPGREHSIHRSVCFLPRIAGTPWLAFCYDVGGMNAYVGEQRLQVLGATAEQIEQEGIKNLCRTPASWHVMPPQGGTVDDGAFALVCQDDPKASERILDGPFLRHAQRMLKTEMLAVSIPARGAIFALAMTNVGKLMGLAQGVHEDAGPDGLSDWCFAVKDGRVQGFFALEEGQIVLNAAF